MHDDKRIEAVVKQHKDGSFLVTVCIPPNAPNSFSGVHEGFVFLTLQQRQKSARPR
jgi:hypothetical protein